MLNGQLGKSLMMFLLFMTGIVELSIGQMPAHLYWGQKELSGVDIYGLFQDSKGVYWLTTNSGILKYDGRVFEKIHVIDSKSVSFFNLVEGKNGIIYCNNLSGQIYEIKIGVGELYYQIPDSLIGPSMYLTIDDQNNLIFKSDHILKLDQQKNLTSIYNVSTSHGNIIRKSDESLVYFDLVKNKLITLREGKILERTISGLSPTDVYIIKDFAGELYFYELISEKMFFLKDDKLVESPNFEEVLNTVEFYKFGEELWGRDIKNGIKAFNNKGEPMYGGRKLFETEFISAGLFDNEGNIILGTFGSGLIFIPAGDIENFYKLNNKQRSRRISLGPGDNLFVGTITGEVYVVNGEGESAKILELSKSSIEFMKWIPSQNELLVSVPITKILHPKGYDLKEVKYTTAYDHIGAVKDVVEFDNNIYLIASSGGAFIYDPDNIRPTFMREFRYNKDHKYVIPGIEGRVHKVAYNRRNETIYAATSNGIKYLDNSGKVTEIRLNGKSLLGRSILCTDSMTYIGTQSNGVLLVKSGKIIDNWTDINAVEAILSLDDYLLTSTNKGLIIKNKKGVTVKSYGLSDGLYGTVIKDVITQNNIIWIEHQKGIQKIKWNSNQNKEKIPEVQLGTLKVNEKITQLSKTEFAHDELRFQYELLSQSMRMKEEIFYQFKLEGIDNEWQTSSFYENEVSYKSLPPGKYKFIAKVSFRDQTGSPVSHSFTILPPFYQTWWFYLIILILVLTIILLLFRYQLKRQKEKDKYINELNIQKLKALRSQMNPHFMFNALNSIQEYIMLNERKLAGKYLGKFADLMRTYLNHSRTDYIALSDEVDAIHLYLELEKLRFQDTLTYEVNISDKVDIYLIPIPSMLIQPYIENALKHGLLHKKDNRNLTINFFMRDEETLMCEVIDNGVGRERSIEINKMRNPNHQSFATTATKRRLDLLNNSKARAIKEELIDLFDENRNSLGTKVRLSIPAD